MKYDENHNSYYDENYDELKKNTNLKNLTDELSQTHPNLNYTPDEPDLDSTLGQRRHHTEYGPGSECAPYNKVLFHDYCMDDKRES